MSPFKESRLIRLLLTVGTVSLAMWFAHTGYADDLKALDRMPSQDPTFDASAQAVSPTRSNFPPAMDWKPDVPPSHEIDPGFPDCVFFINGHCHDANGNDL